MTPSMTAWPPTRISSSLEVRAHEVAVITRYFKYLNINEVASTYRFFDFLSVLLLESFDTSCGVHQSLLAGVERMALRADFQVEFRLRRPRLESFAAGAPHDRVNVVRMYVCFHRASSY